MTNIHTEVGDQVADLAAECDVLTHERDELQYDNAWNEHEIDELRTQLRAEQCAHASTDARAAALWDLLKHQARELRGIRTDHADAVEALIKLAANPVLADHAAGTCPGSNQDAA